MAECEGTFDGEHHWAKRHWLSRFTNGASHDATVLDNWDWVWACVCGTRPPDDMVNKLTAQAAEVRHLQALTFGGEQGEQGRLL